MMEIIKKIFGYLKYYPAITNLLKNAMQTGKIDPIEAFGAFSSVSPPVKTGATNAVNAVQKGGDLTDVAQAMINIGEVRLPDGKKVDTRTMIPSMKQAGGFLSYLANLLEKLQGKPPQEVVDFGNVVSDVQNWQDMVKNQPVDG